MDLQLRKDDKHGLVYEFAVPKSLDLGDSFRGHVCPLSHVFSLPQLRGDAAGSSRLPMLLWPALEGDEGTAWTQLGDSLPDISLAFPDLAPQYPPIFGILVARANGD